MANPKPKGHKAARAVRIGLTIVFLPAVIVVLMMWLLGAFHPKVPNTPAQVIQRPVGQTPLAKAHLITLPVTESAVGTVEPVDKVAVAPKVMEKVLQVNVHAGQKVKQGEVLIRLDDSMLQAKLRQAKAVLDSAQAARDQAKVELDATQQAFNRSVATKIELDRARTAYETALATVQQAQQTVDQANTALSYTVIRSPMKGVVIDKLVNVGDTVSPGQVLLNLYDRMQLVASVRESLVGRLKKGQQIPVEISALNKKCLGTVAEIVPQAQTASRSFNVKVTGDCQPDVLPGMFGKLLIPLQDEHLLVIPLSAVRHVGQLTMVDVAIDGSLHRRTVQLGRTVGDQVVVLAGLTPGEKVALITKERTAKNG